MNNKFILPEQYKEYIDEILEITKLTNKENSILYEIEIEDDQIRFMISFIEYSGDKNILKELLFAKSDKFYTHFLTLLIKKFIESSKVISTDTIDMNEDNKVTYRLILEDNDLFTVNGLTFSDMNYITTIENDLKKAQIEEDLEKDSYGKISVVGVIILLFVALLLFFFIIYFL